MSEMNVIDRIRMLAAVVSDPRLHDAAEVAYAATEAVMMGDSDAGRDLFAAAHAIVDDIERTVTARD